MVDHETTQELGELLVRHARLVLLSDSHNLPLLGCLATEVKEAIPEFEQQMRQLAMGIEPAVLSAVFDSVARRFTCLDLSKARSALGLK